MIEKCRRNYEEICTRNIHVFCSLHLPDCGYREVTGFLDMVDLKLTALDRVVSLILGLTHASA